MAETDVSKSTTTDMSNKVDDFSVSHQQPDRPSISQEETWYDFPDADRQFGYYKSIPELKKAIDGLAMWTVGKGWTTNNRNTVVLENMQGWGADTFDTIMFNLFVQKKIMKDAFAEIIRNERGDAVNLKPFWTGDMRIVVDSKGQIIRYEKVTNRETGERFKFQPPDILHLSNERIGNEIHGTSVVDAVQWVIDARNEAMRDERKLKHRALGYGVMEVDSDDEEKLTSIKNRYAEAVNKGELLVIPKDTTELKDPPDTNPADRLNWIRYLEQFFYQAVGVPQVILGGSQEFTEASSKVGYLTFEQVYVREQRELEAALWNNLGIRIKFNKPVGLKDEVQSSEEKNTGQVGMQQNEAQASATRQE